MDAKEKAIELVYKIDKGIYFSDRVKAVDLALIMVDEIIKETSFEVPNIRQRYWNEVKQEILKL